MERTASNLFRVDRESELPVGIQVAWRLRALISSGKLAPGDRLPPVRQLAEDAGVNPNTARAIYGRLESEGLVETRHGLGTFVAHGSGLVIRGRADRRGRGHRGEAGRGLPRRRSPGDLRCALGR